MRLFAQAMGNGPTQQVDPQARCLVAVEALPLVAQGLGVQRLEAAQGRLQFAIDRRLA